MLKWERVKKHVFTDGSTNVVYKANGCPVTIESRKRAIPHANGSGFWWHTTYVCIAPNGAEKECWRLQYAKEYAEAWEEGLF